jgi:23S rRNA (pseudouridine1915-N3)-methyltransferase
MRITLILVGKTTEEYIKEGISIYENRLKHYIPFEIKIIPDVKLSKNSSHEQLKTAEGVAILKSLKDGDVLYLLDEKGKEFTSTNFSKFLENKMNESVKNVVFVVGGAFGFSQDVYKRANDKISLSKMTFSHQMVRLFFTEQLYRAFTIIKRESYHHD